MITMSDLFDNDLLKLMQVAMVPFLSALTGGFFVHFLAARRERNAKRRDVVTTNLIELWQKIDAQNSIAIDAVKDDENDPRVWSWIVGNMQLFGTEEQVKLTHKFVEDYQTKKIGDTTALLENLKHELRKELGLPKIKHKYFWFRVGKQRPQ